jgi:hypothetical protein
MRRGFSWRFALLFDGFLKQHRAEGFLFEAVRLWSEGRKLQGVEEGLLNAKSTRIEKPALAWVVKNNTSVTGKWIAEGAQIGHSLTASLAINRFARDNSRAATRIRKKLHGALIDA